MERFRWQPALCARLADPGAPGDYAASILRRGVDRNRFEVVASGGRNQTFYGRDDAPDGPQSLILAAKGRLAVDLGTIAVSSHSPIVVQAHPPRPGAIQVVVRRGDGVVGGAVERISGPGMDLATTTDARGCAWFRRLPPGRLRIVVSDPATHEPRSVERALAEGAADEVDVDLAR